MNSKKLFSDFISRITINETVEEVKSIGYLIFEKLFACTRIDILTEKPISVDEISLRHLDSTAVRINQYEPIQYILEEAYFFDRPFYVNPSVLIPRAETEELVHEVINYCSATKGAIRLLDIGTGSGCIAVSINLTLPEVETIALDVSEEALTVARRNAGQLGAQVKFMQHDIFSIDPPVQNCNIIISNPPYISVSEKASMNDNVVKHEPSIALFVPDDDPLIFYKTIAKRSMDMLDDSGAIFFEINERFGKEVAEILLMHGYKDVKVVDDISGKERIVKGRKYK